MEQEKGHLFERQETLLPINSQEACFCIKDAWDGLIRPHPINSKIARWRFRTRIGPFSYLVWASIWLLIGLTFLEEPNWCAYDSRRCRSTSSISDYYPRVTQSFLPHLTAFIVESMCLAILSVDYFWQMTSEGLPLIKLHPLKRGFWHQLLLGLSILSLIVSMSLGSRHYNFRGSPFLRIFFLVVYSRRLRQEFKLFTRIIPQFCKAMFLLLVFFLLYAIIGLSLFSPYSRDPVDAQEGIKYFPDFLSSFSSVFQLFLYWTFPTMMILRDPTTNAFLSPSFSLCLFVFSFMIFTIYFLLNLLLVYVVDVYSEQTQELKQQRRKDEEESLQRAFLLLLLPSDHHMQEAVDDDSHSPGPPPAPPQLARSCVEHALALLGTFSSLPLRLSAQAVDMILIYLDGNDDGWIEQKDFMNLLEIFQRVRRELRQQEEGGGSPRRFIDLWCHSLASSRPFVLYSRFIRSVYLEYFIDTTIILNLVLALAAHSDRRQQQGGQSPVVGHHGPTLLTQEEFSIIAAVIFSIEALSKICVYGWKRYIASYMNLFDAVLTLLSVVGMIYELGGWSSTDARHHALLLFELLRILRLFRALMSVPQFRSTAKTFVKILPSASSLFLILFTVTFIFASLGLETYGGFVNLDPSEKQLEALSSTYYYNQGLYIFNFNDLGGGFIILMELLIDASLIQPFSEGFGAVRPVYRVFIMSFLVLYYCVGQLVILNIVVAFILDAFMNEEMEGSDKKSPPDATIEGGRGTHQEEEEERSEEQEKPSVIPIHRNESG